jgi:hypothetical protein
MDLSSSTMPPAAAGSRARNRRRRPPDTVGGEGRTHRSSEQELIRRHKALLASYVGALKNLSRGNSHQPTAGAGFRNTWQRIAQSLISLLSSRALAVALAEYHVRARLADLKAAYEQGELTSSTGSDESESFYATAADQCQRLADTLSSWKRRQTFINTGLALVTTVWLAVIGADNVSEAARQVVRGVVANPLHFLFSTHVLWFIPLTVLLIILGTSFLRKRLAFLRGVDNEVSIYEHEDAVFGLLERGKAKELPIGMVVQVVLMLITVGAFLWDFFASGSRLALAAAITAVVLSGIFAVLEKRRGKPPR